MLIRVRAGINLKKKALEETSDFLKVLHVEKFYDLRLGRLGNYDIRQFDLFALHVQYISHITHTDEYQYIITCLSLLH